VGGAVVSAFAAVGDVLKPKSFAGLLVGTSGGTYNLSMTYSPNGDVLTANDKANGNWTYIYDDFNRLITAGKATQAFSYVYDRFGNRWQQNVTLGTGPNPVYTFDANNRITGSSNIIGCYQDCDLPLSARKMPD
jgi:hypothetical protein